MSVEVNYARVLLDAAHSGIDRERKELSSLSDLIQGNDHLASALQSPVIKVSDKVALLTRICEKLNYSSLTSRFAVLLSRKGRLGLLPQILVALDRLAIEAAGGILGEVVSADPISDEDQDQLRVSFSRKLGKAVQFTVRTDPELLAGLKVTVDGTTYDGSLRNQIRRLREQLIAQ